MTEKPNMAAIGLTMREGQAVVFSNGDTTCKVVFKGHQGSTYFVTAIAPKDVRIDRVIYKRDVNESKKES